MNILFTAAGRRVEIIEIFKKELPKDKVFAADVDNTAPGLYATQDAFIVPRFSEPACLQAILKLCKKHHIDVIIPLIDPEIDFYAAHAKAFLESGVRILLSDQSVVDIARDKWKTFLFFQRHSIPAIETFERKQQLKSLPAIAKPRTGSAGQGVVRIADSRQLEGLNLDNSYIYQPLLQGEEITVDVITDGKGLCLGIGQRRRLKVRAGEVERAVTVHHPEVDRCVRQLVQWLKPFGIINVQLFKTAQGQLCFQEINLRLGGGCPLTYAAGINIPGLIKSVLDGNPPLECAQARPGVHMLRFDRSLYLTKEQMVP